MDPRLLIVAIPFLALLVAEAAPMAVDSGNAVFAVVTQKEGLAGSIAHDHFIHAGTWTAELDYDQADPARTRGVLRVPVADLQVDRDPQKREHDATVHALGLVKRPFTKVPEKDRALIREHMLAEGQLDAARHPEVRAELKSVALAEHRVGELAYTHTGVVALTVRGVTVDKTFSLRLDPGPAGLHLSGVGRCAFTEFGFKPYSAFLGTIRNKDVFYVYVDLHAAPAAAPPAPAPAP